MKNSTALLLLLFCCLLSNDAMAYPIDGYEETGIRRLLRLQWIAEGTMDGTPLIDGATRTTEEIQLNMIGEEWASLATLPSPDPDLQAKINSLFPGLNANYSFSLLDITEGREVRYAHRKEEAGYQPGSVGKLAVLAGLFCELESLYPDSFEKRQELLKTKMVKGGSWVITDSHTVPFFDPDSKKLTKRTVQVNDVFSLYEWADHMISVSNNSAASVLWREVLLMRVFGDRYPTLTESEIDEYFKVTPKSELADVAVTVVNEPLGDLGITSDEWRLGSMFTKGAKAIVPGKGGSIGTTSGLLKFLIAMEQGRIVDERSSLEMKRLMYQTDRRIRYASSPALKEAAVYFKSGSLYSCKPEEGFTCAKYHGNASNFMNSVAIVEQPDGTTYMIALMSNVLKKNSGSDHMELAARIDKAIRQ